VTLIFRINQEKSIQEHNKPRRKSEGFPWMKRGEIFQPENP